MNNVRLIKADLRAAMNGVASRAIRESGMGYKVVFGVELPRLRQMASDFKEANASLSQAEWRQLAQELWQEDIRECKMLAIMLHPQEEFDVDFAHIWVDSLRAEQAELAQLLAMDLLCHAAYAPEQSFLWMADEQPMRQLCGFLTLTRLLMQGARLSPDAEAEFLDQAEATLSTTYLPLRKAVQNALLRFGEQSDEAQHKTEHIISSHAPDHSTT